MRKKGMEENRADNLAFKKNCGTQNCWTWVDISDTLKDETWTPLTPSLTTPLTFLPGVPVVPWSSPHTLAMRSHHSSVQHLAVGAHTWSRKEKEPMNSLQSKWLPCKLYVPFHAECFHGLSCCQSLKLCLQERSLQETTGTQQSHTRELAHHKLTMNNNYVLNKYEWEPCALRNTVSFSATFAIWRKGFSTFYHVKSVSI